MFARGYLQSKSLRFTIAAFGGNVGEECQGPRVRGTLDRDVSRDFAVDDVRILRYVKAYYKG